jgi:Family of unknown function (DUF6064)
MSVWLSYRLSDFLLFSPRAYYRLFELYNLAVWPAHILAFALGLMILVLWRRGGAWYGRAVAAILAACWLWVAWAYLFSRYDTINWAAKYFAVGFALQALLLAWSGIICNRLAAPARADTARRLALCIFVFALIVQPLVGPLLVGRPWLQGELFGMAPDPTAVATLGLLAAVGRPAWLLFVVPLIWCAISGVTLWTMQSPDALVTPVVAAAALILAGWKSTRPSG